MAIAVSPLIFTVSPRWPPRGKTESTTGKVVIVSR
jgi:hypothetical protein